MIDVRKDKKKKGKERRITCSSAKRGGSTAHLMRERKRRSPGFAGSRREVRKKKRERSTFSAGKEDSPPVLKGRGERLDHHSPRGRRRRVDLPALTTLKKRQKKKETVSPCWNLMQGKKALKMFFRLPSRGKRRKKPDGQVV